MRPTVQQIMDIAKGNPDDRDLWYREYLRVKMSEGWYPGCLQSTICGRVLRQWKPDETHKESMKLIHSTDKKNEKIKQRLEELGYDVHGKKLKVEKKADKPKPATNAEVELLTQYQEMKKKHKDAILLFRVGNNYVAIKEDAPQVFEQTLTGLDEKKIKGEKVQICKFPADDLDALLPKFVRAGKRVAICEQLEDPKKKK